MENIQLNQITEQQINRESTESNHLTESTESTPLTPCCLGKVNKKNCTLLCAFEHDCPVYFLDSHDMPVRFEA